MAVKPAPPAAEGNMDADRAATACSVAAPFLATPWQRLAAAAVDALVLCVVPLALILIALLTGAQYNVPWLKLSARGLPLLYLWLGWGLTGQTVGKRLLGLKVIQAATGRPSLAASARRLAGYMLAAVPLHGGFLPILWDPWRRGWHDRIGGTVVVDVRRWDGQPVDLAAQAHEAPTFYPVPVRDAILAGLSYLVLALVFTWPLALRFMTHRLGGPGHDGSLFMWALWYMGPGNGFDPDPALTSTKLFFYPQGVSLMFHTMLWLNGFLAAPLLRFLPLPAVYNVVMLGSVSLSALGGFCLARRFVPSSLAAWVGGLAFGLSSYYIGQMRLGHLSPISTIGLPWAAFGASGLFGKRWWRFAALAVAPIVWNGYLDYYLLIYALLTVFIVGMTFAIMSGAGWWRGLLRLGLVYAVAIVLLSPLLAKAIGEFGPAVHISRAWREGGTADLGGLVLPNPYNRLAPMSHEALTKYHREGGYSPGLLLMVLAAIGLWRKRRQALPWVALLVIGGLLAAGQTIRIFGSREFPALLLLLIGGPPGNGLGPAWDSGVGFGLADMLVAGGPALSGFMALPNTLYQLAAATPLVGAMSSPMRFVLVLFPAVAVLAAAGFHWLQTLARGRKALHALTAAMLALVLLETWPVAPPLSACQDHPFYRHLAADPQPGAVIDVPVNIYSRDYFEYQTVHHRPLVVAVHSRQPAGADAYLKRHTVLGLLSPAGVTERGPTSLRLDGEAAPEPVADAELAQFRADGFRFIVVHLDMLYPGTRARVLQWLAGQKRLQRVEEDGQLSVWLIRDQPPEGGR